MPLEVKISRSISEIDQKEWEGIYPFTPEGYGYLKTSEETLREQFKFYYVSIYDEGRLAFASSIFVLDYPLETTMEGLFKNAVSAIRRAAPGLFALRAVICGSPTCEGRIGIRDEGRWEEMVKILVREMESIAAKERASIIAFKEFPEGYDAPLQPLKAMRFHKFRALPYVKLKLPFKSFEEYLNSLSRKTRADLRRKYKKVDGLVKIEMEVRNNLSGLLDEAYKLYTANLDRADMTFENITKDYFRKMPENAPDQTKFFTWRIDGRLVAFSLCLHSGDLMTGEYLGFDYSVAYQYHLYFIAFRDKISWCINNGIRRYETGALNYDPKKRLGYRFIPQFVYAKHKNGIANRLLSGLIWLLEPPKHDPFLKTLKNLP